MKNKIFRFLFPALTLLFVLFVFSNSMKNATESSEESGRLMEWLISVFPALAGKIGQFFIRKAAHFSEFGVLGVLFGLSNRLKCSSWYTEGREKLFSRAGLFLISVPLFDETIQLFVPGRSGEIRDLWIDIAGGTLGFLMTLLLTGKKKKSNR